MKKPYIFLDFDGLKFDTLLMQIAYINQRYGINSIPEDYLNGPFLETVLNKYLPKHKHLTNEEVYPDLAANLLGSIELHEQAIPLEGMTEIIPLLAEKYELWTVTARQESAVHVIHHLHEKYIPNCISGIHCVWRRGRDGTYNAISKRDFIQNIEGEKVAFFDDSATEIKRVQDIIPSYLFDPTGLNDDDEAIELRVKNWYEIGDLFL